MEQTTFRPLAGSTILITGATRGIGLAAADALARAGASLIVHGRDAERVRDVCRRLRQSAPSTEIDGVVADLSSLAEVRRLAREVDERCDRLQVLVNNAGLVTRRRQETVDGYERQFAVNHLAPFLLTNLLLDKLTASAPARIINVSSMAHRRAAFDLDDLNWENRRYNALGAYGATKLANILFTRELARRLEGTGVTANCLHPGVVGTNIFGGLGVFGRIFGLLGKPFLLPATEGAATTVYLAASDELGETSGQFFDRSRLVSPSPAALDDAAAARLWAASERLARLGN